MARADSADPPAPRGGVPDQGTEFVFAGRRVGLGRHAPHAAGPVAPAMCTCIHLPGALAHRPGPVNQAGKPSVVMMAFSAWRESSRVYWTTTGTDDSITLA